MGWADNKRRIDWDVARVTAVTLVISFLSMLIAIALKFPAPFFTGPILILAVLGLATPIKLGVHAKVRDAAFLILGMTIGAAATPDLLQAARAWPLSIVMLYLSLATIMLLGCILFQRLFAFSRRDAILGVTPGHLSLVLALAADSPDAPRITLIQSVRLVMLTLAVPFVLQVLGLMPQGLGLVEKAAMSWSALAISLGASAVLGWVFLRLKVPAALLLAGMIFSMATAGTGIILGKPPSWLSITGFIVLGGIIGSRFSGVTLRDFLSALSAGLVLTALSFGVTFAFASVLNPFVDSSFVTLLIAFAPGGLEVMAAMAIMLNADPTFVAAHHLARMLALPFIVTSFLAVEAVISRRETVRERDRQTEPPISKQE